MDQPLCRLNLVCSPDGADRLIEKLLRKGPGAPAFTSWSARGHGHEFKTATVAERVRGHVNRTVIALVIKRAEAKHMLQTIAEEATGLDVTYWIEPVESFGQLNEERSRQVPDAPADNRQAEPAGGTP